jgi:site-specific DNA-methyltransferase (adenine-specific)/modification methylase
MKEIIGDATLYLGDCAEILPTLDKVDAVVTDPPYGIGESAGKNKSRGNLALAKDYGNDDWDISPISDDLMKSVVGAGRNAIVFGGNYYAMPPSKCWLIWDKENTGDFADAELAWTNLNKAVRLKRYMWNGMLRANKEPRGDHPTQKPIGIMEWCISHLPEETQTILDPFMGSGTTGVACMNLQRKFIGIEKNPEYYDIAQARIKDAWVKSAGLFN